jgi:hypothetical protein
MIGKKLLYNYLSNLRRPNVKIKDLTPISGGEYYLFVELIESLDVRAH